VFFCVVDNGMEKVNTKRKANTALQISLASRPLKCVFAF